MLKRTRGEKIFAVINVIFLTGLALLCLLPIWNLLAVSLSAKNYVQANMVSLAPRGFTTSNYHYMLHESAFWEAFAISGKRVVLGVAVNLLFTISAAYPLSKRKDQFGARGVYAAYFLIPMVFTGGLIPTYLVVSGVGLIDTLWALVLPEALEMYYVLLMMNFFRGIPGEIEEAALVDGASWLTTLVKVYLPLSLPSLATITLYALVHHWNAYFDGMIYMNNTHNYPLMTYLRSVIEGFDTSDIRPDEIVADPILAMLTGRSVKAAGIILCTIPMVVIYPFLQKFFVHGLTVGSVKG
ncbi:MAG: carbohydrate ABC transporter permease [Clostridia bacterium]|nr:carbohydrate ABC transporter permease [Clostridia bacterium]